MKGELGGLVAVVASWFSGYGGYSQTPWVRVPQLPVFLFSPFSSSRLISNKTSTSYLCTIVEPIQYGSFLIVALLYEEKETDPLWSGF